MPDNRFDVRVSFAFTQLQKVRTTVADSMLDDGPDDAAVRQYMYSEAAGYLQWRHSLRGSFPHKFGMKIFSFINKCLSERYGKTTEGGNHEHSVTSRSPAPPPQYEVLAKEKPTRITFSKYQIKFTAFFSTRQLSKDVLPWSKNSST